MTRHTSGSCAWDTRLEAHPNDGRVRRREEELFYADRTAEARSLVGSRLDVFAAAGAHHDDDRVGVLHPFAVLEEISRHIY